MAKPEVTFDLVNRTSGKAVNLSSKFLGDSLGKAEKVWVVRCGGKGVLLLPFDGQVGPQEQAEHYLASMGLVPEALPPGQPTDDDDSA